MSEPEAPEPTPALLLEIQEVLLHNADSQERLVALQKLQKMLRAHAQETTALVLGNQMPAVDCVVKILAAEEPLYPELSIASEIVSNLASSTSDMTELLVRQYKVIPLLVKMLNKLKSETQERKSPAFHGSVESCIWALGNIAGDNRTLRNAVISAKATDVILDFINTPTLLSITRVAFWSLSNLVRGGRVPSQMCKIVPTLLTGVMMSDEDVISNSLWALSYLADDDAGQKSISSHPSFFFSLKVFLQQQNQTLLVPALRTVGNMLSGPDKYALGMINQGLVEVLLPLLSHKTGQVRKETAWGFSNILGSNATQTGLCMQHKVIDALITTILTDPKPDVAKEAGWALANTLCVANNSQLLTILQSAHFIQAYSACLLHQDRALVSTAYSSLKSVLRMTGTICDALALENHFVEYLRIHCERDVANIVASGGELAQEALLLHWIFRVPGVVSLNGI